MTDSTSEKPKKSGGAMDTFKGICILVLLLICAGAGGYFFGTYQKFAPIENVPPGTPGAISLGSGSSSSTSQSSTPGVPSSLKKKYWLQSSGHDHMGYAITVSVNGQLADKFFTPDKQKDITNMVHPGENTVTFEAKQLPEGMNEHKGQDYYHLTVSVKSGPDLQASKDVDTLLNYSRTAADNKDYNDQLTFLTLE